MKNKALQQVLNMETIIASALIFMTLLSLATFFFKWIALALTIIFGIASFFYIKGLYQK